MDKIGQLVLLCVVLWFTLTWALPILEYVHMPIPASPVLVLLGFIGMAVAILKGVEL
jgi:xanthosine utilization system XapX-like protein